MSRTYKDRPYEVRAKDLQHEFTYEHHDHTRLGSGSLYSFRGVLIEYPTECPIDDVAKGRYLNKDGILSQQVKTCSYELMFNQPNYRGPRKGELKKSFWGPMRAAEKKQLNQAKKSYNTHSEINEDFFLQESTNHACYGGGWWD